MRDEALERAREFERGREIINQDESWKFQGDYPAKPQPATNLREKSNSLVTFIFSVRKENHSNPNADYSPSVFPSWSPDRSPETEER